jgi:hypothetical protein
MIVFSGDCWWVRLSAEKWVKTQYIYERAWKQCMRTTDRYKSPSRSVTHDGRWKRISPTQLNGRFSLNLDGRRYFGELELKNSPLKVKQLFVNTPYQPWFLQNRTTHNVRYARSSLCSQWHTGERASGVGTSERNTLNNRTESGS